MFENKMESISSDTKSYKTIPELASYISEQTDGSPTYIDVDENSKHVNLYVIDDPDDAWQTDLITGDSELIFEFDKLPQNLGSRLTLAINRKIKTSSPSSDCLVADDIY